MIPYDLSSLPIFAIMTLWLFGAVISRYFLVTGLFFLFGVWVRRSRRWRSRIVNPAAYYNGQFWTEIKWSILASLIFALSGAMTAVLWQKGYTAIYLRIEDDGLAYLGVSLILAMLIHETYYYWLHRWMHQPNIFRWLHRVHHQSRVASPWTAFSFHPLEAGLQALFLPAISLLLPLHPYVIVVFLLVMTLSSVVNHLNIEIYPQRCLHHWPGKLLIGATHHGQHHAQFNYNFGLYFTFWDLWLGTEAPQSRVDTRFLAPDP
jgi:Delta7-sterol 5-desaturase